METPEKEKSPSFHTKAPQNIRSERSAFTRKTQVKLDKSALVAPAVALGILGIRHRRSGQRLECYCPFHKNGAERTPSLMVDARDGHFRCFTCGVKGGDVVALHRLATGSNFRDAIEAMGVRHD